MILTRAEKDVLLICIRWVREFIEDDPRSLDWHYVDGKTYSDEQIRRKFLDPLCKKLK